MMDCCSMVETGSVLALAVAVNPSSSAARPVSCCPASNFKFLNGVADSFVSTRSELPDAAFAWNGCWFVACTEGAALATESVGLAADGVVEPVAVGLVDAPGFTWLVEIEESVEAVGSLTGIKGAEGAMDCSFPEPVWLGALELALGAAPAADADGC